MTLRQTMGALALAVGLVAAGGGGAVAQGKKSDAVVKATATATKAGDDGKQTVTITLEIDPKFHIYANPVGQDDFKDNETMVSGAGKTKLLSVAYPPGETKEDKVVGNYKVYKKSVTLRAQVQREKGDTGPLELTVKVQACDDSVCLQPGRIKVSVP